MEILSPCPSPLELTHEWWELIAPSVPAKTGIRPPVHPRRRIVETTLYRGHNGKTLRMMPRVFQLSDTTHWHVQRRAAGEAIPNAMRSAAGQAAGPGTVELTAIIHAQTRREADAGIGETRGHDEGDDPMRHLATETPEMFAVDPAAAAGPREWDGNDAGKPAESARSLPGVPPQIVGIRSGRHSLEASLRCRPIEHAPHWNLQGDRPERDHARQSPMHRSLCRMGHGRPIPFSPHTLSNPASGRLRPGAMPRGITQQEGHEPP